MQILFGVVAFLFGTIVGSFFNVVLLRKNTGESITWDRSRCFSCGRELLWYDNIPLASFVMLRGRCRHCQSKISWQYPLVEFLVGILFVLLYTKHWQFDLLNIGAFLALFLVAAYDIRTKIIDATFLRIFALFAALAAIFRWNAASTVLWNDVLVAVALWFFFWAFWYFSDGAWMGRGDSSVAFWCALLVGFPFGIAMLFLSFWIGSIVGVFILLLRGRKALRSEIPFAPFLALGTFLVLYFEVHMRTLLSIFGL